MRKQYHFRPGHRGLNAWDVDRLVVIADRLPTETIPLSDIVELGDSYWFDRGQEVTVREIVDHMRLVNAADLGHAIIVDPDGRVLDGMHRVAKALLLGHQTIEAKRLLELPDPHYTDVDADELPYDE